MTIDVLLILIGVALPLAGWSLFRKPSVPFFQFGPASRIGEFLTLPGVVLYWGGLACALVGVVMRWMG